MHFSRLQLRKMQFENDNITLYKIVLKRIIGYNLQLKTKTYRFTYVKS